MDQFVNVVKPSTSREVNRDKGQQRPTYRFNPYAVSKSNERKFEAWKEKKRTEKYFL